MKMLRTFLIILLFSTCAFANAKNFKIVAPDGVKFVDALQQKVIDAYESIGHSIEVIRFPARRALNSAINADWVDGELARVASAESVLTQFIRIPVPIHTIDLLAVTNVDNININSWQSLAGKNIASIRGFIGIEQTIDQYSFESITSTSTAEQALKMLKQGRVDVVVLPEPIYTPVSKSLFDASELASLKSTTIERLALYHYIHKKNYPLVPNLTQAFISMDSTKKAQ